MSREDKPLDYQRRIRDTRTVAQRLDLDYLRRPAIMTLLRSRMSWAAVSAAVLLSVPLLLGVGGGRRALENGPVSESHVFYEARCEACHTRAFGGVPDTACKQCHDGAAHPAFSFDTAKITGMAPRCAECHVEHRGRALLAEVSSGNCTTCHGNLALHATGMKVRALEISAFRPGRHPEFSPASYKDQRPLRLNHAAHMPAEPKNIRGMKLPMQCVDCHVTNHNSPKNDPLPVTFDANCQRCHSRELEFDVYQVFGSKPTPAPHTRDKAKIDDFIRAAYRDLLAADPEVARRPLGSDLSPQPSAAAWLERVVHDSEDYLFNRKCVYCHAAEPMSNRVHRVAGRYSAGNTNGEPWLVRGEFSHRAHRAVQCESCHTAARASTKTEDVLIPVMKDCMPCHGGARAELERCSRCHLYHDRALEQNTRQPIEKLLKAF